MKSKIVLTAAIGMFVPFFMLMLMFIGILGTDAVLPVTPFATEEEVYNYQYVGTELGVPWDIVILCDGIHAQKNGIDSLEAYNPLLTSLQFCILVEDKYELVVTTSTETITLEDGTVTTMEVTESEWVYQESIKYKGKASILDYISMKESDLSYADVNQLVSNIYAVAEAKSTEELKYEVALTANTNYEEVLRNYIGLDEKNIKYVLELYEANYMEELYGYDFQIDDIELPEIIQGKVTRYQLARVAVSLLNHPYMMGGKSGKQGPPTGPLDCSGYVDWVYIQCFGKEVSSGSIPDGVAVSGTALMWYACKSITESELQVGDLGFVNDPAALEKGKVNHVGIYIGNCNGQDYWIHCGGSYYGTETLPSGRVGISVRSGSNNYNPVDGTTFEPAMKGCDFKYFRRPQFAFEEEVGGM